jgi:hypothetical protein
MMILLLFLLNNNKNWMRMILNGRFCAGEIAKSSMMQAQSGAILRATIHTIRKNIIFV